MIRALVKGLGLGVIGRVPGGTAWYRNLTRSTLGTQATHVDKLRRVWPGYVEVWEQYTDAASFDDLDVWIHEGGWTPFPSLATYLLTGSAGTVTNRDGRVLDRYLARAVDGALGCDIPTTPERLRRVTALRWAPDTREAIHALGGRLYENVDPGALPLEDDSVDLCHSGGTLEHYPVELLEVFLRESRRVVRPGGLVSHVFDHRDHLHHADPSWHYLAHLAVPDGLYRILYGNPLLFHNRLLPADVMALFERAGFERVAVRRLILPQRRYVDDERDTLDGRPGIDRAHLARRFRGATGADLRTAAAHYLYRAS